MSSKLAIFVGGVVVVATTGLIVWFVYALLQAPASVQSPVIAGAIAAAAAIAANYLAKRREIAARHFDDKRQLFRTFMDVLFGAMMSSIKKGAKRQQALPMDKLLEIKKLLMIWASAETIKAWSESMEVDRPLDETDIETLIRHERFLRAMRKDLGHNDSALADGELIQLIIRGDDKKKLMGR